MRIGTSWIKIGTTVLLCGFLQATAYAVPDEDAQKGYEYVPIIPITNHFELGARMYYFNLRDTVRQGASGPRNANVKINYIGSLWGLEEIQDYVPRLYAQYAFHPYFGIGATYDHVEARTLDSGDPAKNGKRGDGIVEITGPMVYLFARYPNSTRFTPLAEVGGAYYFSDFGEAPEWTDVRPGFRFEVDDTTGYFFALGVDVAITPRWHMDLYWRRMYGPQVDARAYFTTGPKVGRYGSFPMEYEMGGWGVSYRF
jgi:hypothetical protein